MTEVSKDQFFSKLREQEAKGKDIMPTIINSTYPYTSEWRNQRNGREVFGRSVGHATSESHKYFVA